MLGRHRKALAELGRLFKQGKVGKTYWAVVEGGPAEDEGRIDLPLGRLDESRGWWMKPDPHGQPAVTTWKVLGRCDGLPASADSGQGMDSAAAVPSPLVGEGQGGGRQRALNMQPPPSPPLPRKGGGSTTSTQRRGQRRTLRRMTSDRSSPGWRWSR